MAVEQATAICATIPSLATTIMTKIRHSEPVAPPLISSSPINDKAAPAPPSSAAACTSTSPNILPLILAYFYHRYHQDCAAVDCVSMDCDAVSNMWVDSRFILRASSLENIKGIVEYRNLRFNHIL